MATEGTANTLYYGDNLKVLRDYVPGESVDPTAQLNEARRGSVRVR